jgi:transcriptional regulator with XRE-family HTH domain
MAIFECLGKALSRVRELRGASQTAVARQAQIGKSQLSKYESGKELPKLESLERVLGALGVGYFEFFRVLDAIDREEEPGPRPTREEVDELFNNLTKGIFALHREIVKELSSERNEARTCARP